MEKHKILIVDDEHNVIRSLRRVFRSMNYEIYTAESGFEALKLVDQQDFSLILSDYRMPELNGIEFLKMAKEKSPSAIRMILTGFADIDVVISAINEGEVYKFWEKPWEEENLKIQVKRAIEYYEVMQEKKVLLKKVQIQNKQLQYLNDNLEEKVIENTKDLRLAYAELEMKVKELEGRDKILQFLLTLHTLEETLDLILKVILEIKTLDTIAIYIADKKKKIMTPIAGYIVKNHRKSKIDTAITKLPELPVPRLLVDEVTLKDSESIVKRINDFSYFIPILKDNACLGGIFIDNSKAKKSIESKDLAVLTGFSTLAALAINDYLVTSSLPDMQSEINEMLGEFK